MRVTLTEYDPRHTRIDQRLNARARTSGVVTGFERDDCSCTCRSSTSGFDRDYLGMIGASPQMRTFSDDCIARVQDDAADSGIWAPQRARRSSEAKRALHCCHFGGRCHLASRSCFCGHFAQSTDHGIRIFGREHRGAGDEHIGTGCGATFDRVDRYSSVDL